MSAARDALRELVEQLADEDVPAVVAKLRKRPPPAAHRPWPPAFFGAGQARRSDVAARSGEILEAGFSSPA